MDLQRSSHAAQSHLGWIVALAVAGATFGTLLIGGSHRPALSPSVTALPSASSPVGSARATRCPSAWPQPTWSASPYPAGTPAATTTATTGASPDSSLAPTAAPTAGVTPRPTPRPTLTPGPTATPPPGSLPSTLVRHGSRTGNHVALTFDMGGRVGDALAIMAWLVEHDVHATVFITGAMADSPNTDAGRRVLALIDQHPELLTLGNHSYSHRDFRNLTAAEIRDELRSAAEALASFCGQDPRPFFRPPNGGYDGAALAAVGAAGYPYTVTWDIDTIDWRPIANEPAGPTADEIVAKVLGNAQGGSIVLMHLGGYETYAALPRIISGLRAAGFDLVTLDELL